MHSINTDIFFFINGYAGMSPLLDAVFLFITTPLTFLLIGGGVVWFVFIRPLVHRDPTVRLYALRDTLFFLVALFMVYAVVELLKGLVSYPRPHQFLHGIRTLIVYGDYDSFPSLHAALSFALATVTYRKYPRVGVLLFGCATLVGISRVFVGVHFPIDIIVGAFLGVSIPVLIAKIMKQ